jgi:hypothetical protein
MLAIDDELFWRHTLPEMVKLLSKELTQLSCAFKLLTINSTDLLYFNRLEILLILISMFVGIMPPQPQLLLPNFGDLMQFRNG